MNAIVTGASRGIGKEIVKLFADSGINVIAISRHMYMVREFPEDAAPEEGKGKVIPLSLDITNVTILRDKLLDVIKDNFKSKVDIVINNAGILRNKPFEDYIGKEINQLIDVNFSAPAQLTAMLIPYLKKSKNAHVVNISSMGGYQGSVKFPGLSYYSATKAALAVLTEALAEEYKEDKIAFNCLALGAVETEMLKEAFPDYEAPLKAKEMAAYIVEFAQNGQKLYNGKILPISSSTP
jgi:3-oxoacyl-[acyl-carrier protein] reductase